VSSRPLSELLELLVLPSYTGFLYFLAHFDEILCHPVPTHTDTKAADRGQGEAEKVKKVWGRRALKTQIVLKLLLISSLEEVEGKRATRT
jgi:hypothetical protein